jgi:hypothetical protein
MVWPKKRPCKGKTNRQALRIYSAVMAYFGCRVDKGEGQNKENRNTNKLSDEHVDFLPRQIV